MKKVALFAVLIAACYVFFGPSSVEQGSDKQWMPPKVLSKSLSEKELDQFPAEAFSYIAMIDVRRHVYILYELWPAYLLWCFP